MSTLINFRFETIKRTGTLFVDLQLQPLKHLLLAVDHDASNRNNQQLFVRHHTEKGKPFINMNINCFCKVTLLLIYILYYIFLLLFLIYRFVN